jgi:hypothetical protein
VAFCALVATFTDDRAVSAALWRTMELAPWLSIPIGLVAALTGLVLGLGTAHGVVRYWWLVAKLAITVAVVVTDAVVIHRLALEATRMGHASTPVSHGAVAHVVVLAIATVLSVFKPGGRTPWGRGATGTTAELPVPAPVGLSR